MDYQNFFLAPPSKEPTATAAMETSEAGEGLLRLLLGPALVFRGWSSIYSAFSLAAARPRLLLRLTSIRSRLTT